MEGLCVNREQKTTDCHHPTRHLIWLQTGEGDRDDNHGEKSGTTTRQRTSFAGIYGILESLQLLGWREMHGYSKGVWPWD